MKLIHKNNFISIVCISYTVISLLKFLVEDILVNNFDKVQFELIQVLIFSTISVLALSLHSSLSRFSTLTVIFIQYIIVILGMLIYLQITVLFTELHPNAYSDMFKSVSILYFLGATLYYIRFMLEIKKHNNILQQLKKHLLFCTLYLRFSNSLLNLK